MPRPHKPAKPIRRSRRRDRINDEMAHAFAAGLFNLGATKGQVKTAIREKYGGISIHTIEGIITGARKMMVAASGFTEDEHKNMSFALYHSVFTNPRKGDWIKLKARELADKLLAIRGPIKIDLTGSIATRHTIAHRILKDPESAKLLDALDDRLAKGNGHK